MRLRRSSSDGPGLARVRHGQASATSTPTATSRPPASTRQAAAHRDWEVRADRVNQRFKELAGEDFTVKDMRTWTATVLAAIEYAARDVPSSRL